MIYAKERLTKMSEEFINCYKRIRDKIYTSFPEAVYDDSSAQKHVSFKLPISKKSHRLFATFDPRPNESFIVLEIFVNIDELNDSQKLCYKPNRKDIENKISLLKLTPDIEFDYCFDLIRQSYENVKLKHTKY